MTDIGEEVDKFVAGIMSPDEGATPPRKRRKVAARAPQAVEPDPVDVDEDEDEDKNEDEEVEAEGDGDEDQAALLPRELPRPAESHRSLDSVQAKYGIGETPDFKVQLHRLLPKFFPGGIQATGFMDEFTTPITEAYVSAEYGGGTYEARVMGPDPKTHNGTRRYDSIKFEVSGLPNPDRLARSVRAKLDAAAAPAAVAPVPAAPMVVQENPTLATQAMKMAEAAAAREREDRIRAEDKAGATAAAAREMFTPVVEAERRRHDEVLQVERERAASERKYLEDRLQEARDEYRRLEAKVEAMNSQPQRSVAEEIEKLMPMFKDNGEAAAAAQKAAESITKSILERHQIEIESLHKQHQTMLESLRQSHINEIQSLREANAREIAAEREAGNTREQRHQETLRVEREERRRDMELYKRTADERDQQWRDRMEQQELNLRTMWESRVETQKSNYESQLQWMRSEKENLESRVRTYEAQLADRGDIVKQLTGMRDLRSVAKDALGIEDAPPPSSGGGGIGLSGTDDMSWKEVISTALENFPAIMQQINGGQGAQMQQPGPQMQQPQQPPPQPGQIIQTPQGTMVVVQTPNGLALAPKDQFDAYQTQLAQQRTSRPQVGGGGRPRGILAGAGRPKPSDGIPVPNMAEGLPKPRPWGEAVQPPMPSDTPPQHVAVQEQPGPQAQPPQPQPRRGRQRSQQNGDGVDPKTQALIANEVAKLVHKSIEEGDEPEEFAQKILSGGYPDMIVKTIVGMGDDQVVAAIAHAQPTSAGTTPRGQRFVREALAALRSAI